jgi:Uma2 family endonuclease
VLALRLLASLFDQALVNQSVLVSTQDPIQLDDFSEPEPDLALIRGKALDYANRHPRADEVYLVVEIADSTLNRDLSIKQLLYAQLGIPEYWVLDLKNRQIHRFREPNLTGYGHDEILAEPSQISPLVFAPIKLNLSNMLPPLS